MLKNLKSLFIVDDDEAGKAKPDGTPAPGGKAAPGASASRTQPRAAGAGKSASVPAPSAAASSDKMTNRLLQAIDAANLEGFDYLEYKRAVKALQKFSMDEVTKYRSAFTTAATMGVTLDELVSSAKHYLHVLDNENSKFSTAFQTEYDRKITQSESDVKRLRQEINDKAEQIKKLQQEIEQRTQQVAKLEQVTEAGRAKVLATRDSFLASYAQVKGVIEADIERMQRYLQ